MEKVKHHKIVIIGAGPSGATMSLLLSKHKIPHLLLDQATFPRDKICGDGLTPEVPRVLREIDEELYQEFIKAPWNQGSFGSYLELKSGLKSKFDFREFTNEAPYFVAKRIDFDDFLVKKTPSAYAEIALGHKVHDIERVGGNLKLSIENTLNQSRYSITCGLLIGADGERSIVKKTFHPEGIRKNRQHHAGALRCYFKNVSKKHSFDPLEFYQIPHFKTGYFWIFHLPNKECNVGIGGLSMDLSDHKIKLREVFWDFIHNHPELKERFKNAEALENPKGWGIPLNSNAHHYIGDNYFLLGDSGSMGEPLTGKGIGVAMFVALQSIPYIVKAYHNNSFKAKDLNEITLKTEQKFRKEWQRLYRFQKLLSKSFIANSFLYPFKYDWAQKLATKKMAKNIHEFILRGKH